ncbi:MAG: hypothetical protein GWN94_24770 [Phycisphaerae bacterium]|nr:hypothetical protein [Phycisphaerae bacterium]NIP55592.1 hypothetical protein [Phycisphaerae bacterium]NIS54268.1 hypothetical protein [Phycisphaerae bacterium]NIX31852.1 hypothetical protein [Phycisphaerae bacterium]
MLTKILRLIEILALALFFGFIPLIICLAATVLFVGMVFGTEGLGPWTLWSLLPGLAIDIVFLRKWVRNAYQINTKILAAIYIFYAVVAIGMCMGIPIFHFVMCITAGIYIARKMLLTKSDEQNRMRAFKRMARFCAAVMALICCLMTLWAIVGQMIGEEVETPLLTLTFTVPIFFAVVLTGGAVLVLAQYWLTATAAKVTFWLLRPATKNNT